MGSIDPLASKARERLLEGLAIPACPLALNASRRFDARRQRGLLRYYRAAGVGGLAVGVHTTQFAIRDPAVGLLRPILELAAEIARERPAGIPAGEERVPLLVAGVCGRTDAAVREAELARELGYDAGLVSLSAFREAPEAAMVEHVRHVAEVLPVVGFYLQPSVGGRLLSFEFWRQFATLDHVVAIKIAPFNRYQTLDVIRAVAETGRDDLALYTGNDDAIVMDLLTPFRFRVGDRWVERRIVGGLLGHWAVGTRRAVEWHAACRRMVQEGRGVDFAALRTANEVTDCNAAYFDAAHGFAGCIAGLHEVLRRQGLLEGIWCLDPEETLSPGQAEELTRVRRDYPHWQDDAFIEEHRDAWLAD